MSSTFAATVTTVGMRCIISFANDGPESTAICSWQREGSDCSSTSVIVHSVPTSMPLATVTMGTPTGSASCTRPNTSRVACDGVATMMTDEPSSAASSEASSAVTSSSEVVPASSSSEAAPASSSSEAAAVSSSSEAAPAPAPSSSSEQAPASSSEAPPPPSSSSEQAAPASSSEQAAPASSSEQAAPASSEEQAAPSSSECPEGFEIVDGKCVPIKASGDATPTDGTQSSAAQ